MSKVIGVLYVVSDLDKMVSFFTSVLEFREMQRFDLEGATYEKLFQFPKIKAKMVVLQLGNECIYLAEFFPKHKDAYPKDSHSNDLWFQHIAIVVSDMEKAYEKVMKYGVQPISESVQTIPSWNEAAGGIKAFYFRSPDGHPLELIYYPKGKGKPIWQNKESLFLGIDHTAISVSNTDIGLQFYQNVFGMDVAGHSLNYGETQEKLSGVSGAKVKITGLTFPESQSMGVEFLEYQNPLYGRKKPEGTPAHHLMESETVIAVDDVESVVNKLQKMPTSSLSKETVFLKGLGIFKKAIILADPDGHRILLVE